jgi:predicted transcriptional regulator
LAQATISQHLKALKELGIIKGSIEGVSICYCINPEKWAEIKQLFNDFLDQQPDPAHKNFC